METRLVIAYLLIAFMVAAVIMLWTQYRSRRRALRRKRWGRD